MYMLPYMFEELYERVQALEAQRTPEPVFNVVPVDETTDAVLEESAPPARTPEPRPAGEVLDAFLEGLEQRLGGMSARYDEEAEKLIKRFIG